MQVVAFFDIELSLKKNLITFYFQNQIKSSQYDPFESIRSTLGMFVLPLIRICSTLFVRFTMGFESLCVRFAETNGFLIPF